jgi:hypothetical protein
MSTGTGVWRQTIARVADLRARSLGAATRELATAEAPNTPAMSLVRQIFFSRVPRTRVLFASADNLTNMPDFCARIGRAVAGISHGTVGLVARNSGCAFLSETVWEEGEPGGSLWRIPFKLYETHCADGNVAVDLPRFDYLIFGASIGDSAAPLFCKASAGAVLVITANHTRREAALRAKEILLSWNVELLGAVLDRRTFPVPQSIYSRL